MDFESLLASIPSAIEKEILIREAASSEQEYTSLLQLALNDKDPLAWRAAWILDGAAEANPDMALKHIRQIVRKLPAIKSGGTIRSLLRMLSRYHIPEEEQGLLIDLCFRYMVSELYPVAVKVHAMQILYNHCLIYPDLKDELKTVIEDQISNNSVGFMARGRRIIRQLEKL